MDSNVIATLHSGDGDRAVKIVRRADGRFGLKEFRRDPEDAGGWTFVRDTPEGVYATEAEAGAAARSGVAWLRDVAPAAKG
jgi:hypothetical protein